VTSSTVEFDNSTAQIAIIGGTGLNNFQVGRVAGDRNTPFGQTSADIIISTPSISTKQQQPVAFLARHGNPHNVAPHKINYRANLWALKCLGVDSIIAVNAVGGIDPDMSPGSIVLPDQLIDYTYGREHTFYDGSSADQLGEGLDHCDFSFPFNQRLREQLVKAAELEKIPIFKNAVYAVTQGPRLESAAEINRLAKDDCDIVGMTAMPEAALARELGIDYASVCLVVNPAAGLSQNVITMEEIQAVLGDTMVTVRRLLSMVIALLHPSES
jgi:5'-methylthioinosine phosphorylase